VAKFLAQDRNKQTCEYVNTAVGWHKTSFIQKQCRDGTMWVSLCHSQGTLYVCDKLTSFVNVLTF